MQIAILDTIGLPYTESTVRTQGLGGSESAAIFMAQELQKLGMRVTLYNSNSADTSTYEQVAESGVIYRDLKWLSLHSPDAYDVLISSRSVFPFADNVEQYGLPAAIRKMRDAAAYKVLWMHDTFCQGDDLLEQFVVEKKIDKIFTLSDFHTSYVTTCTHGPRRNFEVLKKHIFVTRNGIRRYHDFVDISKKDPNLYVYNASVTKGLLPLVNDIWPKVKGSLPLAKLMVIGGYYRNGTAPPDAQEIQWRELSTRSDLKNLGVTFTGVIPQWQVADILAKAKFTIYPAAFPETFGISTLESLAYNTPVLTNRFGALEETAIDDACYKIDYPIVSNSLFPHIDAHRQTQQFVDMVLAAARDTYLYSQKAHTCSRVHDVADWSSVALQWKQHFCQVRNAYLSAEEFRAVSHINYRVGQVFGRRFTNSEDRYFPQLPAEQTFAIISPFYNAASYIAQCIHSVAAQDYPFYTHILIDDASTDSSYEVAQKTIAELPSSIRHKFVLLRRQDNMGSVYNYVKVMQDASIKSSDVIVMLDGDDALMPDNQILSKLNAIYVQGAELTYGSMWSEADQIPLIAQEYPPEVKQTRSYRNHLFPWNMPYTHLRTFKKRLFESIPVETFQIDGKWARAGGDTIIFYETIERADPEKIHVVKDVWYRYNDVNPINDYKVHATEQTATANLVLSQRTGSTPKRVLLAIPTAKYIEVDTFKSIYDLHIPDGIQVDFQYFYGYQIDQIRNLIAHWVLTEQYDYLFSVDSDMVLPAHALQSLLRVDSDIVSGVYVQRTEEKKPELYVRTRPHIHADLSMRNLSRDEIITAQQPFEVDACGFGCVLVKRKVFEILKYPHFRYHSAIDHAYTVSEDVDFCNMAKIHGFRVMVDPHVQCGHKTTHTLTL